MAASGIDSEAGLVLGYMELQAGLSAAALIARLAQLGGGTGSDRDAGQDGHTGVWASADSLLRAVAASRRFRRDTPLGSILHRSRISFREIRTTDSLHIIFHRNHVSAHVDRISPLNVDPDKPAHYSWPRVLAHNISAVVDAVRRKVGRRIHRSAQAMTDPLLATMSRRAST